MELRVHGRNIQITEQMNDHISKKASRLVRHLPGIALITVELAIGNSRVQDHRAVAQVTLDISGAVLRGEERGANAMAALDAAMDVMDRRVGRYKGKAYKSEQAKKTGKNVSIRTLQAPPAPVETELTQEDVLEAEGKVVRVKRFPVKPVTVQEAAFQMELLGHNFFLFLDAETEQHNLLYRRNDGDYGLIKPEPL